MGDNILKDKKKRVAVKNVAFTGEMLEAAQKGHLMLKVGITGGSDGSRRLIKGKNDRQPIIRGDRAPQGI